MLKPEGCALMVIDMQNAWLERGAASEKPAGRIIIPVISKMIQFCRSKKMPIIWIQSDHSPLYGGLLYQKVWSNTPAESIPQRIAGKGTHAFRIFSEMPKPLKEELRIIKHKFDAFYETGLDILLRNLKIDTVIITGVTSEGCCESTARSAHSRDYKIVFASDGTATDSYECHKAVLERMHRSFGRVMTVEEMMQELEAGY